MDTEASGPSSKIPKRDRQITDDWFQCPPIDYTNVSSLTYPRGLRSTLAEIDESNTLVEVLRRKGDQGPFVNSGQRKADPIITLYLETKIDNLRDASTSNVKFVKLKVNSEQLLEAILPAFSSMYSSPYKDPKEWICLPPFSDLFFAQGRIIEIMKHGNMGPAKSKQLRILVTAMRVVMEGLNEQLREMAAKKIIDFKHLWALHPLGSFAVVENCQTPHIVQVVDNSVVSGTVLAKNVEEGKWKIELAWYVFDGYNIATYTETWTTKCFSGDISVASMNLRPLRFEEKVNPSVVKDAVEIGRKSLDYQSHHYCHYIGPAYPAPAMNTAFEMKVRVANLKYDQLD